MGSRDTSRWPMSTLSFAPRAVSLICHDTSPVEIQAIYFGKREHHLLSGLPHRIYVPRHRSHTRIASHRSQIHHRSSPMHVGLPIVNENVSRQGRSSLLVFETPDDAS